MMSAERYYERWHGKLVRKPIYFFVRRVHLIDGRNNHRGRLGLRSM